MGIKYFEDIVDGEQLHCRQVFMTRASIIEFAKQFDPQPFHIDEYAADDSIEACWAELKKSNSKPDRGFASIKCNVNNQSNEPVIEYGYRYLLACKDFEKL